MAEKRKISSVNPVIEKTLKAVLKMIFKRLFNLKLDMPREVVELEPPYVLLPVHQGFWDPFLAGSYLKDPVYYITSDAVFRGKLFGFLLKFLGAIPKTKSQSDLDALKNIFEMKDSGRSIGIFPEGQRTWNGTTLPLIKSTSKLVRMLKLPVVTVVFKGGYFSHPRWGTSTRKGELRVEYKLLFKGDEVGSMKVDDIHNAMTEALAHDEIEYQKKIRMVWKTGRLAENMEQILFVCPSCGSFDGFTSRGDNFKCTSCNNEWHVDKFQDISAVEGETKFDNIRDWDLWQIKQMQARIDEFFETEQTVFHIKSVEFQTGYKTEKPKVLGKGSLSLTTGHMILKDSDGAELKKIPVTDITGINVQNRNILDFYYDGTLFIIQDNGNHLNSYMFWKAVDDLQRRKYQMNLPD
ncbi:MAG: lysophospholipid acyltransferase family protein [Spirochaetales bacterium]|uniref:Lysophospholipid acyltransferase family protein n=1 Tax=Candidatus Thalassospirochaeta sargassi TaxID=3119039 RepID=A0AAJ1IED7_9SPIO|nr:lysophospholipid acyltransferase family protein [Spirochaetales bacterium]